MTRIELLEILTDETKKWWSTACRIYAPLSGNLPTISLELRGMSAGKATVHKIWYNPKIAENNLEDFLARTVPHEVAHTVDRRLHAYSSHHGPAWKKIMRDFGVDDTRCHSYKVGVTPARRIARFMYECQCPEPHMLTSIRHKRIQRGQFYHCNTCDARLIRSVQPESNLKV